MKFIKPTEMAQLLQPFQKMAGAIFPIDSSQILVLRDNTENVKRMLEMINKIDVSVPAEFLSEVIPIKYAKAEDIASALNSVGGGGGGSTLGTPRASGTTTPRTPGGAGVMGLGGQPTRPGMPGYTGGQTTPMPGTIQTGAGTPSSSASFSQRLNKIIQNAAASGDIEILGKTKIIADLRSNSLLVFATRQDMDTIKDIVAKLDVVLAQVLIETIIMDVGLDHLWNYGISAGQQPHQNGNVVGGGMLNNDNAQLPTGAAFLNNLISSLVTNTVNGSNQANFVSNPNPIPAYPNSSGLNYFGKLGVGPSFDVAVQAAASDSTINVIQKPRILTSHATPAYLFVGGTVPYVSSTYYGGGYAGGPSSSYQQLPIGIGLNVTPFINPDGLVVMQIDESIDEISGSTAITGVGNVPNTTHRQLTAEVAVRDRETIVLGGFIRNSDSKTRSGVPLLMDIPILGKLFTSRGSTKARTELMVLMRPTVLRTPELAAKHVEVEKRQLPGVLNAEREYDADEMKALERMPKGFKEVTPFPPIPGPSPAP